MNKRIAFIIIVIIVITSFYMLWFIVKSQKPHSIDTKNLNSIELIGINGSTSSLSSICNLTMIVYFSTECGFCDNEIFEIYENIDRFENVDILIISSEPLVEIIDFSANFNTARLHFFSDNTGRLKKELNGTFNNQMQFFDLQT